MGLRQQITEELKAAMKAGETGKRDTLRLLDSMLKNTEIEKGKREAGLSDEETLAVIAKAVKQRQDSIGQFVAGGRPEMAAQEEAELAILQVYLPEQLSAEAVKAEVAKLVATLGEVGPQDFGKVMGQAMVALKGRADGNLVKQAVEAILKK